MKWQQKHDILDLQFNVRPDKYKSTKCIDHLFGRAHKRKTRATTDRFTQLELKLHRQKSASMVEVEIENELGISSHIDTI